MIKKVAKKNKLPVIDLHSAMDGMPELFPDHIHPNEEGAKVMAKAVYDAIKNKGNRRSRQGLISKKEIFIGCPHYSSSFCCVIQDNQLFLFPNLE